MITIDPNNSELARSEREFLRRIELRLKADAEKRWQDLREEYRRAISETFGEVSGAPLATERRGR